jgi:hypothetical protein
MNQFQMPWDMTLPVVLVQTLQTSFAYLACRGLILGGLCCMEMMVVDLVLGGLVPAGA